MSPSTHIKLPPVKVLFARGHEKLLELRLRELRAQGMRYEVICLDDVLRPKRDSCRG